MKRIPAKTHFLLMTSYKLFSFFFPLFLVKQGLDLSEVGYAYLFLYLPLVLFTPLAARAVQRFSVRRLAQIGIGGYALYAGLMLLVDGAASLYAAQVLLGISASLFYVATRSLLMSQGEKQAAKRFGRFYAATFYADALAPAIGAVLIWQLDFTGVFLASVALHVFNIFFVAKYLPNTPISEGEEVSSEVPELWHKLSRVLTRWRVATLVGSAFLVVLVGGVYRPFFVLFLQELGWTQNGILLYGGIFSAGIAAISPFLIRYLETADPATQVVRGSALYATMSLLFGLLAPQLQLVGVFITNLGRTVGGFVTGTSRSIVIMRAMPDLPEEAGALDTTISPLGTALGALIAGSLAAIFSLQAVFIAGSILVGVGSVGAFLAARSIPKG